VGVLLLAGCGGDDGGDPPTTPTAAGASIIDAAHPYLVLEDPYWDLQEAVDYREDNPLANILATATDWFIEYDHCGSDASGASDRNISIAALDAPMSEVAAGLSSAGLEFEPIDVGAWNALGGLIPSMPEGAKIILVTAGEQTIEVQSHDLSLDELAEIPAALQAVDESGWIAIGGVVDL